jgi:hypothetical protein
MSNHSANQSDQSQAILENLWQMIRQLPDDLRLQLRARLDENLRASNPRPLDRPMPPLVPPAEFAAKWEQARHWMERHRQEYAGRWVALDGDRLLTDGSSAREVYAVLKSAGVSGSLVMRVEHPDDLSVIE